LCKEIGAEPFITLNISWDSEDDSKNFLEYCNGDASTHWGKQRIDAGYREPFNVKYWSLGNEMGYGHMEGLNAVESYTWKALSTAIAMRKTDAAINLCNSGPYPNGEWVRGSLSKLTGHSAYAAYHSYMPLDLPRYINFTCEQKIIETHKKMTSGPYITIRDIIAFRKDIDAELGDNDVKISFDEWNAWYAWYRNPSPCEGLFAAVMLNNVMRTSETLRMPICCYFQPVNEGAIDVDKTSSKLTNIGMIFEMFSAHIGGKVINVNGYSVRSLAFAENDINTIERNDIDFFASYNEKTQNINMTCVNKSHSDLNVDLNLEGFGNIPVYNINELYAENIMPGYSFTKNEYDNTSGCVVLKKYSVTRITAHI